VKSTSSAHYEDCGVNAPNGSEVIDESSPCGRKAASFPRENISGFQKKSFSLHNGVTIPAMQYKMLYSFGGTRALEDADTSSKSKNSTNFLQI
jgi:hypothetical protein